MFDLLKKKINGFVDKLTKKEEKQEEPISVDKPEPKKETPKEKPKEVSKAVEKKTTPVKPKEKPVEKRPAEKEIPEIEEKPLRIPKVEIPKEKPVIEKVIEKVLPKKEPEVKKPPKPEPIEHKEDMVEPEVEEEVPEEETEEESEIETILEEKPEPVEELAIEEKKPAPVEEEPEVKEEKPRERIKLGAVGAIKSFITREVEISDDDVKELLENLELELLESDVELSVAESIREDLMEKLVGAKTKKDDLHNFINNSIKETLIDTISNEKAFDIVEKMSGLEKPVKIMFLGVNGAGKTTTIGKVAKLLMNNDKKVVFAAADTFRAAAIEQMGVHADRLGIKMIKRDYGSDPTSVAYDAMNYAKARGVDAVLIDTAGRQDTNISLINEIKKMNRIIQPELKIYIGESIAGNAILEQIQTFDREIGIDGVILTKLDCDPKGGTMLSINKTTGIPIIYVGIGQRYEDLELFNAAKIVERIVE